MLTTKKGSAKGYLCTIIVLSVEAYNFKKITNDTKNIL